METDKQNEGYTNNTLSSLLGDRYSTALLSRQLNAILRNNIKNPRKVIDI
tara:strand:+ start:114 stop:263 length:150 start_codon:yes stop_codon:yes gene_type:complete